MSDHDNSPISARDAKRLFAGWKAAPAIVLAVSGGPDSIALMCLSAARPRARDPRPLLLPLTCPNCLPRLKQPRIAIAADQATRGPSSTRPRQRSWMPVLAAEGGDVRSLARLASRLARANAAVEVLADGAERYLALKGREALHPGAKAFDA